jgi:methylphosphotriester-DNA--protein-cysteine methyltransferase
MPERAWLLTGADGKIFESDTPGRFGGHRRSRIYGRLDCRTARQAIARGGYIRNRVFFRDEASAVAAGYRPCAVCMPAAYAKWKR